MRYQWRFPDDVCGNADDVWVHAVVVCFTLYHYAWSRRLPLLWFALLEALHGYSHSAPGNPWSWVCLHYCAIACAYSIKPAPIRIFVPFLCIDVIGHLAGNDMISIATTLVFAATRFASPGLAGVALSAVFVPFAFIELIACEWSDGHLHEAWDMSLSLAMMAGVRWYSTRVV